MQSPSVVEGHRAVIESSNTGQDGHVARADSVEYADLNGQAVSAIAGGAGKAHGWRPE